MALIGVLLFCGANFLYHHSPEFMASWPKNSYIYFCFVVLPFGVVLPAFVLGRWARDAGPPRRYGIGLSARDWTAMVAAFGLGGTAVYFGVGKQIAAHPDGYLHAGRLFATLAIASIAEAMVFIGLLYHACEDAVRGVWNTRAGRVTGALAAIVVSSVAFGLFHFTYYPPWNTWETARTLAIVWVFVAGLYALTRSLAAAAVFDNLMAVIGFVRNDITPPRPVGSALLFAIIATAVIVIVLRQPRNEPGEEKLGTAAPGESGDR